MTTEQKINKYLHNHKGELNAVHCKEMVRIFHLNPRTIRRSINNLRKSGVPICSSEKGYWLGKSPTEVNKTIRHLGHIVNEINNTRAGLVAASVKMLSAAEISIEIK